MVQAFVPLGYHCLSCSTATKCSFAFQRLQWMKSAPCGPAPTWKLLFIVSFDSYLAISLTISDMCFCRVDPHVEVDGWRVSSYFYIVAMALQLLSLALFSFFDTCTVGLTYTLSFLSQIFLSPVTLTTVIGMNKHPVFVYLEIAISC